MPSPKSNSWYNKAIELMVREGLSLKQAAAELEIPITPDECKAVERLKSFQKDLWAARHRFSTEIAKADGYNKSALVGLSLVLIYKLIQEGSYEKAMDAVQRLSRLEGWDKSPEVSISLGGLTTKDIEEAKKKLELRLGFTKELPAEKPLPN